MKKMVLLNSIIMSGMLTAALEPDAIAEIVTIKELPVVGGENEWDMTINRLAIQFPQEEIHFVNVSKMVDAIAKLSQIHFPQGPVGDAARTLSHTTAKITLGSLREDVEKQLKAVNTRVMDRSYSAKNKRIIMVRALYEQLLAKINALQEQMK